MTWWCWRNNNYFSFLSVFMYTSCSLASCNEERTVPWKIQYLSAPYFFQTISFPITDDGLAISNAQCTELTLGRKSQPSFAPSSAGLVGYLHKIVIRKMILVEHS
jgi:hypothetical protein